MLRRVCIVAAILLIEIAPRAQTLLVTEPIPLISLQSTTNVTSSRIFPAVVSNGKSALLLWSESGGHDPYGGPVGWLNAFATPITPNGELLEPTGHFVARSDGPILLFPAGQDYFAVFQNRLPLYQHGWTLTRLSPDGHTRFAPIPVTTANSYPYLESAASDGKTVLFVSEDLNKFSLLLFDYNGHLVAKPTIPFSVVPTSLAVSGLNGAYLLAWQSWRTNLINCVTLNATNGVLDPVIVRDAQPFQVETMGANDHNLLLLGGATNAPDINAYVSPLLAFSPTGEILAQGSVTNSFLMTTNQIVNAGDAWTVFLSGHTFNVQIQDGSFTIQPDPFAPLLGIGPHYAGATSFGSDHLVVADQFGSNVGCQIVDRTNSSPYIPTQTWTAESGVVITDAPFGYLSTWLEGANSNHLRAIRYTTNGTAIDLTPVDIEGGPKDPTIIRAGWISTNYYLVWGTYSSSLFGSALIANSGEPQLRLFTNQINIFTNFTCLRYQDRSFLSASSGLFRELTSAGALIPQASLLPGALISNGHELLLLQTLSQSSNKFAQARWVDPFPSVKYGTPIVLGPGAQPPIGAASGNQFLVAWIDPASHLNFARLANGALIERGLLSALPMTNTVLAAGGSSSHFLVIASSNFGYETVVGQNTYFLIDRESGEVTTTSQRSYLYRAPVSIASAGKDFLVAQDLWHDRGPVATLQSVLNGYRPEFLPNGELIFLDPRRSYSIEQSADLEAWDQFVKVSGVPFYQLPSARETERQFFRARMLLQ